MSDVKDYGASFFVSGYMLDDPDYQDYIRHELVHMEKEAIYKAVKQIPSGWICINPEIVKRPTLRFEPGIEYSTIIHCRPVQSARVYVPVFERQTMPIDVYECKWCGGYTKNDYLGHCAGCGGPRDNSYIEKLRSGQI